MNSNFTLVNFNCLKCGDCCRNIIGSIGNASFGLYLNENEAKYFPQELVVPLFRSGDHIFAYQLTATDCPMLKDGSCSIYENRPLGCRAFPLKDLGVIDFTTCRYTSQNKLCSWDTRSFTIEADAIRREIDEANSSPEPTHIYIFKLKQWIKNDRLR